jgi:hypothetical protein
MLLGFCSCKKNKFGISIISFISGVKKRNGTERNGINGICSETERNETERNETKRKIF